MDTPSTWITHKEDAGTHVELPQPGYRHPYTLNDLPLYQVKRKACYERRSRLNALVIGIVAVRQEGHHV